MTTVLSKTKTREITSNHALGMMNEEARTCYRAHRSVTAELMAFVTGVSGAITMLACVVSASKEAEMVSVGVWWMAIALLVTSAVITGKRVVSYKRHIKTDSHRDKEWFRLDEVAHEALRHEKDNYVDQKVGSVLRDAAAITQMQQTMGDLLVKPIDALGTAMRVAETVHRVRLLIENAPASLKDEMAAELADTVQAADQEAGALSAYRAQLETLTPTVEAWREKNALLTDSGEYAGLSVAATRHKQVAGELSTATDSVTIFRESLTDTLRILG